MRARAMLAVAVCATTLLSVAVPALAHDDSEVENGPLEVDVRPAVAKVDHPVQVAARFDADEDEVEVDEDEAEVECDDDELDAAAKTDDDESECDDETEDDIETASKTDEPEDDEAEDDEAEDDEAEDDEADEAEDDEVEVECDDELDAAAKTDDDESDCDDVSDDADDQAAPVAVTFVVDFGDGSEPETMQVRGEHRGRGHGDGNDAKAKASHSFAAEGDYEVTVTATPEGGDPVEATALVSVGAGSARLEGGDRIDTALRISRDSFDDGTAGAVLLARADGFADALASATLALAEQAPLLLVPSGDVPDAVLDEIDRVLGGTGRVYLLGGEAAITPAVADELTAAGHDVVRVAGDDRVATSVAIAQFLVDAGAEITEVVLASASSFPDALAGAAYAAEVGAPVLLTAPDALSDAVRDLLATLGTDTAVTVVGGTAGVSDAVIDELVGLGFVVERLAGDDRYDTAVEIAEAGHLHPTVVVIATGRTFPDALAGGAYAGRLGAPLLLTGEDLSDELEDYLRANASSIKVLVVLGGGGAVPQPVMDEIEAALGL